MAELLDVMKAKSTKKEETRERLELLKTMVSILSGIKIQPCWSHVQLYAETLCRLKMIKCNLIPKEIKEMIISMEI